MRYSVRMKGIRSYFRKLHYPRKLKKGMRSVRISEPSFEKNIDENGLTLVTLSHYEVISGHKRTKWVNRALSLCNKMAKAWIRTRRQGTSSIGRPYDRFRNF